MDQPLVSVVIPTFNRPDYLRIALRSVRSQRFAGARPQIEIIIHDNASKDDVAAVVADFQFRFPDLNIRYYCNEVNIGQSPNIIAAIKKARGKYLALLADDDTWEPDFLAAMVLPLERDPECILAFCNYDIIDADGGAMDWLTWKITRYHGNHLLTEGYHQPFEYIATVFRSIAVISGCVLRRDATDWTNVPADVTIGLDTYMCHLGARTMKKCYFDSRKLFSVRHHTGTVTSAAKDNFAAKAASNRAYVAFWSHCLHDSTTRWKRYYFMRRGDAQVALIVNQFRLGCWRVALHELVQAVTSKILDIRVPFYHLGYLIRFKMIGLARRYQP